MMHEGSCLCGQVEFTVDGKLYDVVACHCQQCRKQSGSYYTTTAADDNNLQVKNPRKISWYASSSDAKRGFCASCGSTLFWKQNGSSYTAILAGAFDTKLGVKISKHIFCAQKGDYYEITDDLPQFEQDDAD